MEIQELEELSTIEMVEIDGGAICEKIRAQIR